MDDQRMRPAPEAAHDPDALEALTTADLDEKATAYLEDTRERFRSLLAGREDETTSILDAYRALPGDIEPFLSRGANDAVTAVLRLEAAIAPLLAFRLDAARRADEAVEVMRQSVPAYLVLGGDELGTRIAVHAAGYASQEFKLEAIDQIERDLLSFSRGATDGVLGRAAAAVRAAGLYRVGDAAGAIEAAHAAMSGRNDWIDGFAEIIGDNARRLGGTDDGEDPGNPPSILQMWMAARSSGDREQLTRLVLPLVRWGRRSSPVEQAMALSEAAAGLIPVSVSQACHYMLQAAENLATALAALRSAEERSYLLGALPGLQNNILQVIFRASKLGVEAADRAAYDWIRQLSRDPDLPEDRRDLSLVELVELHAGLGKSAAPTIWRHGAMAYDIRFLQYDRQVPAGWRFMFDNDDNVQMEPFTLSSRDAANLRRLTEAADAAVLPGECSALRRALFGPWIDTKIEIDLLQEGPVLVRRCTELSDLQLGALSIADGTRTAWPLLVWTDRIEGRDMP